MTSLAILDRLSIRFAGSPFSVIAISSIATLLEVGVIRSLLFFQNNRFILSASYHNGASQPMSVAEELPAISANAASIGARRFHRVRIVTPHLVLGRAQTTRGDGRRSWLINGWILP